MKIRSGLKAVFQNHNHTLSDQTLANFIRSWNNQYGTSKNSTVKNQYTDTILSGTNIFQHHLQKDAKTNEVSCYRWGSLGDTVVDVEGSREEPQPDNHE